MGELLANEGVKSVVVEGYEMYDQFLISISNVYRRNKAITAFSKDVKVILLGLKSAASGTNLTQATHIVLMGTCEVNERD
jgi:SNF2 family DNA or RNA helicase